MHVDGEEDGFLCQSTKTIINGKTGAAEAYVATHRASFPLFNQELSKQEKAIAANSAEAEAAYSASVAASGRSTSAVLVGRSVEAMAAADGGFPEDTAAGAGHAQPPPTAAAKASGCDAGDVLRDLSSHLRAAVGVLQSHPDRPGLLREARRQGLVQGIVSDLACLAELLRQPDCDGGGGADADASGESKATSCSSNSADFCNRRI